MYHGVPAAGFSNHGLFNYNMRFFFALCQANHYEVIDAVMGTDPTTSDRLNQDVLDFCASFDRGPDLFDRSLLADTFRSRDAGIRVILRRPLEKADFNVPLHLAD